MDKLQKIIFYLFAALFFFVPLVLWPATSEVFEFNKMVLVYLLTALITATWLIKSIFAKKFIFRRTILDIPIIIFLLSDNFFMNLGYITIPLMSLTTFMLIAISSLYLIKK